MSGTVQPIRIIVFDLGGVVVRICRSLKEAAERVGLPVDPTLAAPEFVALRRAAHGDYERGLISCEQFFLRIAATTRGRYTSEQFRLLHVMWIIDEYSGIHGLIDDLHRTGLATGALSNTNAAHWAQMSHAETAPAKFPAPAKLQHRHASHLLGLAKPDPAIYAAFSKQTGFAPGEIVFFDDLRENVAAARAAGWHAHEIDHAGDPPAQVREHLRLKGVRLE